MNSEIIIALIALAIVALIVFGVCFLALKDYNFSASVSEEKIEVAGNNSDETHK